MSNVRFVADLHFGHEGCAKWRNFGVDFMNENIIAQWNSVVHKKDTTYILGDITQETSKHYHLLDELLGRKIVILGNHDRWQDVPKLLEHVDGVAGIVDYRCKYLTKKGIKRAWLTHSPMHPKEVWEREINIHGHSHDVVMPEDRYICVSLEQIDWRPKLINELI